MISYVFILVALFFCSLSVSAKALECIPLDNSAPSIPAKKIAATLEMSSYQMGDLPGLLVGVVNNGKTQMDLATHTAGLPREISGLNANTSYLDK